jgi:hypothetical protein
MVREAPTCDARTARRTGLGGQRPADFCQSEAGQPNSFWSPRAHQLTRIPATRIMDDKFANRRKQIAWRADSFASVTIDAFAQPTPFSAYLTDLPSCSLLHATGQPRQSGTALRYYLSWTARCLICSSVVPCWVVGNFSAIVHSGVHHKAHPASATESGEMSACAEPQYELLGPLCLPTLRLQ